MKGKLARLGLAALVSCGLLAIVLSRLNLGRAWARFQQAELGWIAASVVLTALVLGLRGMRFSALMRRPDAAVATAAVAAQGFLTRVTPFRLGELVIPYALSRYAGEDPAHTLVSLLLVRLIDLCLIAGTATVAAMAFAGPSESWRGTALVLLVALAAVLFTFRGWLRLGVAVAGKLATASGLVRFLVVQRTVTRLDAMLAGTAALTRTQQAVVTGWSLAIFVVQTALIGTLPRAFGVHIEPLQLLIGASIAQVGAALPVASVGSIGTLEAAWVAGFVWVGVPEEDAILTAVAAQVLTLGYSALFAGLWWLYLERRGPAPEPAAPG